MNIRGFFLKYPFTGTKVTFPQMDQTISELQNNLKMKADLYDTTPEDLTDNEYEVVPSQLPDWEDVD